MTQEFYQEIASTYGTPTYVFDTAAVQARVRKVAELFGPKVRLCYSIKANPFLIPAMLEVLPCLEVCSPGELAICESLGGFVSVWGEDGTAYDGAQDLAIPGNDSTPLHVPALEDGHTIIYSGVHKDASDIREAIRYGAGTYTAESMLHAQLLEQEAAAAEQTIDVLLRLNAGAQFGMSREDLLQILTDRAQYPHLRFVGIHYFVGTQRKNKGLHQQREELAMLHDLFVQIREEMGIDLPRLEYGPGLPVPLFANEDASDTLAPAREIADTLREVAEWCELTVEMGRYFVTECGYYLTSVVDTKVIHGKEGDKRYAITDGGIHHVNYLGQLMGMKVPVMAHIPAAGADAAGESLEWAICGSLCTTNDDLVRSVEMTGLSIGSLLVFANLGAYSVTEGMYLFLSRTMPRILLYNGEQVCCVRKPLRISEINTPMEV